MSWASSEACREARQLKHPNIVRLLTAYKDDALVRDMLIHVAKEGEACSPTCIKAVS